MTFAAFALSTILLQGPSLTSTPMRPLGTLREQAAVQQERSEERRVGKEC